MSTITKSSQQTQIVDLDARLTKLEVSIRGQATRVDVLLRRFSYYNENYYNFLFHPLANSHSTTTKIIALLTNIALTAITCRIYLVAFVVAHCLEKRRFL